MTPMLRPRLVNGRFGDPALLVEIAHERDTVLFDLGDCSLLSGRDLLRIGHIFVSHMHMDHFIGFDALVRANVGRGKRIVVVGPDGMIEAVGHRLAAYTWDLAPRYQADLVFEVRELHAPSQLRCARFSLRSAFAAEPLGRDDAPDGLVTRTPSFSVSARILEHHGPCLGFAIAEPLHVNVWRNRIEERGLPIGPWLKAFKDAVRDDAPGEALITLPGGNAAPLASLRALVSVEQGQKLGYVTDVRDTSANRDAIVQLCCDADTLFIEASFAAADGELALHRGHLTTAAAGAIARSARARRVEPFHFSPRYSGLGEEMRREVETAFRSPRPSPDKEPAHR